MCHWYFNRHCIESINCFGAGRGQWGEGFSETMVRDAWTKPRGRVEAGEGGAFGWSRVEGWGKMQTTVIEQQ